MRHLAFIVHNNTDRVLPEDHCADAFLQAQGITVHYLPWQSTPVAQLQSMDALCLRTCYSYDQDVNGFLSWLRSVNAAGLRMFNSPDQVVWNTDKNYLHDLADAGVPTIDTAWLPQGSQPDLTDLIKTHRWDEVVIKPNISAGARNTWRVNLQSAAAQQARLHTQLQLQDLMVQPFLSEVQTQGEWSLVFFQGTYSHAVLKTPQAGDYRVQGVFGGQSRGAEAPGTALKAANRLMKWLRPKPVYARVDGLIIKGAFVLMELELIEPYLYLNTHPEAIAQYQAALALAMTEEETPPPPDANPYLH